MQDHQLAFRIAEDEDIAVAEVGFFNGLFQRHGAHGDGFIGADQMNFGGSGHGRILVDHDRDRSFFGCADDGLKSVLSIRLIHPRRVAVPFLDFLALAR